MRLRCPCWTNSCGPTAIRCVARPCTRRRTRREATPSLRAPVGGRSPKGGMGEGSWSCSRRDLSVRRRNAAAQEKLDDATQLRLLKRSAVDPEKCAPCCSMRTDSTGQSPSVHSRDETKKPISVVCQQRIVVIPGLPAMKPQAPRHDEINGVY